MRLHLRTATFHEGLNVIYRRSGTDDVISRIDFSVLNLSSGQTFSERLDKRELGLVILGGKCNVQAGDKTFTEIGERENVFAGKAYAVYVPGQTEWRVEAVTKCQVALCYADWEKGGEVRLITPEENVENIRGRDNWTRRVVDIIDERTDANHLIVGETYNPPGNWSSYPPHKHEVDNPPVESFQEEVYYFKLNPPQGFGFIRQYTDDRELDVVHTVEDGDTVLIPKGYHPVVAAPGYELYYLWILSGNTRKLMPHDDPAHTWVKG